jgi:3',5'-cyclic AMP phosphodiesterase CpdA
VAAQQPWISAQLAGRATGTHAFLLTHKGLNLPYHTDVLLGNDPSQNAAATDAFMASLSQNGVRYLICGHDHMHDRSIVTANDGKSSPVTQLVSSSNSNYNYFPRNASVSPGDKLNDSYTSVRRRKIVAQELNTFGYYIVTVDGPNVTFEFYSSPSYAAFDLGQHQWDLASVTTVPATPPLNFSLHETFGYSLVGKDFQIPFGSSFTAVSDTSPNGTVAKLLSGSNVVQDTDYSGYQFVRSVSTGWATGAGAQVSDIFYLWGLHSTLVSSQSETYALQMSYNAGVSSALLNAGKVYIAAIGDGGGWVNAASANFGGTPVFVLGAWNSSYPLGTYGVDVANGVAWAVVNYDGVFAVTQTS